MRAQACAVLFKADVNGFLSAVIGKTGMTHDELFANAAKFIADVKSVKKGKRMREKGVCGVSLSCGSCHRMPRATIDATQRASL